MAVLLYTKKCCKVTSHQIKKKPSNKTIKETSREYIHTSDGEMPTLTNLLALICFPTSIEIQNSNIHSLGELCSNYTNSSTQSNNLFFPSITKFQLKNSWQYDDIYSIYLSVHQFVPFLSLSLKGEKPLDNTKVKHSDISQFRRLIYP